MVMHPAFNRTNGDRYPGVSQKETNNNMPKKRTSIKVYPITFAVEGKGEFPFDMLRYDVCFPATQNDVSMLNKQYEYPDREGPNQGDCKRQINRTVRLTRLSGNTNGPTVDRWKSFGWTVIDDGLT